MTGLDPIEEGADQLTVTELSFGLKPDIVGALGESPKDMAFARVTLPEEVSTTTLAGPPIADAGLTNESKVPSALSFQFATVIPPTVTLETPTRNDPESCTFAPPVFGINARSELEIVGV